MWQNFFAAGGWGMYPTMVFGFGLLASVALDAFRKDARLQRVASLLGVLTLASGLLGTCVGICKSAQFIDQVPPDKQLQMLAFGAEESLHNLVLALIIIVIAGLFAVAGALRRRSELSAV